MYLKNVLESHTMPCTCVQLQWHLYTYTKVLRDESRKIKYFTPYGKFIKWHDSRNCNTTTHLANLCPKSIPRTSPKDVLWTSPFGSLFNAKGCSLLTSWGQSRSSTKVFSTLKYDVLRTFQYSVLRMSSHCPICNNKKLPATTSWGRPLQRQAEIGWKSSKC